MNPHDDVHLRNSGLHRVRGGVARSDNLSHRRFPRGRPLSLVVVLLAFGLLLPATAAATYRQATPGPDRSSLSEGVTVDRLIEATLDWIGLPMSVDTLALTRVTLSPGAEASALNGSHLVFVESGALTVQEYARIYPPPTGTPAPVHEDVPAGPPVTYGTGEQFLAYYDVVSPPSITNEGEEPAVALVVSVAATGGGSIADSLTGWAEVEPLAVEDAARMGPPLFPAGGLGADPLAVALERRTYERAEADPSLPPPYENAEWRGARLIAVESGALNVRSGVPALYRPAGAAPQALPSGAQVSLVPGDQLLALAPGRIATRNVARGPSTALFVTVAAAATATSEG
jgi:hypothetical protein